MGNAEADTAADLGRRHQSEVLIDARRRLLKTRGYWYPIMLDLHRFMIAVAGITVNHDGRGGTASDPLVRRFDVVVFPVVTQRPDSHGQPVWRTIEISQLQFAPGGRCLCGAGRAGFLVPS